jgi:hypothetical protein
VKHKVGAELIFRDFTGLKLEKLPPSLLRRLAPKGDENA